MPVVVRVRRPQHVYVIPELVGVVARPVREIRIMSTCFSPNYILLVVPSRTSDRAPPSNKSGICILGRSIGSGRSRPSSAR